LAVRFVDLASTGVRRIVDELVEAKCRANVVGSECVAAHFALELIYVGLAVRFVDLASTGVRRIVDELVEAKCRANVVGSECVAAHFALELI